MHWWLGIIAVKPTHTQRARNGASSETVIKSTIHILATHSQMQLTCTMAQRSTARLFLPRRLWKTPLFSACHRLPLSQYSITMMLHMASELSSPGSSRLNLTLIPPSGCAASVPVLQHGIAGCQDGLEMCVWTHQAVLSAYHSCSPVAALPCYTNSSAALSKACSSWPCTSGSVLV